MRSLPKLKHELLILKTELDMENKTPITKENKAMPYDALLGAVNSFRAKILTAVDIAKKEDVKYQLQYKDYDDDMWTLPILLLSYRVNNFVDDASLKKVRLIFKNGCKIVLDA